MIAGDDCNGLGGMLKEKYFDGIDRRKMARASIRRSIINDLIDDGLLTVEQGLALMNGTPIKPRPWWVRAWLWIRRMV